MIAGIVTKFLPQMMQNFTINAQNGMLLGDTQKTEKEKQMEQQQADESKAPKAPVSQPIEIKVRPTSMLCFFRKRVFEKELEYLKTLNFTEKNKYVNDKWHKMTADEKAALQPELDVYNKSREGMTKIVKSSISEKEKKKQLREKRKANAKSQPITGFLWFQLVRRLEIIAKNEDVGQNGVLKDKEGNEINRETQSHKYQMAQQGFLMKRFASEW